MDKNRRKQEKIKKKWINELQIKEFSPIHIIQIPQKAEIAWNCVQKYWEILLDKDVGERVITHELGHLYFPKKVNDLRLLPKLAKPEKKKNLNKAMHKLINPLVDNFVDYYLLDIDNYYNLWVKEKREILEYGTYLCDFKAFYQRIGDFMCEYLNCLYILKDDNKNQLHSKIEHWLAQIEKSILVISNFNEVNLEFLKNKLDQFKELRTIRDSERILLFFYEIITEIGKIFDYKYWDKNMIIKQFDIIFNFQP
ncbi:hypothetical protein LCGC14_0930620 [marine sediment metagenome]|uniref:Uncharacterized protein n=1 Tax=marine sediment metagenome TaxID=412755 RepID=A0A0F9NSM3_9ZZZZ